jgi:predicted Rdx family selenoprotein
LAAEIKEKHGVDCELVEGHGGIFDVHMDGKLLYSKDVTGRFPEHHEVLDQIAAAK